MECPNCGEEMKVCRGSCSMEPRFEVGKVFPSEIFCTVEEEHKCLKCSGEFRRPMKRTYCPEEIEGSSQ